VRFPLQTIRSNSLLYKIIYSTSGRSARNPAKLLKIMARPAGLEPATLGLEGGDRALVENCTDARLQLIGVERLAPLAPAIVDL
jgi:hypothetical protein